MTKSKEADLQLIRTIDLTSKTTLSSGVAEAVCDFDDIDPLSSEFMLYEYLDTDALDILADSVSSGLHLRFPIEDIVVCISKPDADTANIYVDDRQQ